MFYCTKYLIKKKYAALANKPAEMCPINQPERLWFLLFLEKEPKRPNRTKHGDPDKEIKCELPLFFRLISGALRRTREKKIILAKPLLLRLDERARGVSC